ncbi:gamma-glutamyltransferase [Cohnella faecalis]|uniref:Glutathione hydrolase proenzyme n=2 Tax=Cohnella faecalis TaxID=2315694 RepID=A0A398D009_9BACL|nr:gamma-glutamyltransferase [Cohnella faecalis]RIE04504.1 gamma-glutamyltransferase [Cohnella faecalis]
MPKVKRAMVATPHYLATAVGSSILQGGGNAYDAAVAVSAALSVVYPHMTGLGGDAFFLLYDASRKTYRGYNGSGRSSAAASVEYFKSKGRKEIPHRGIESALTVPGMADAWWSVWREGGKLPWHKLIEPAAAYAEEGFPISRNLAEWIAKDESLLSCDPGMKKTYLPGGQVPREGSALLQPELAESLRTLQREGRDAMYTGTLMKRIVEAVRQDGGLLGERDFAEHRGEWVEPLKTRYRGCDVYQMPPNSQGFSLLMMLNMLENMKLTDVPRHSAEFYHLAAEVVKRAFVERDRYLTDPEFNNIPLDKLLSKPFAQELFRTIRMEGAGLGGEAGSASIPMGQDTAYAAIVDEEGNAVSFIQSLYFDFGSCYMAGDTGIILQNRGSFFSLDPSAPNVLEPRKRSFHTLMPGMVARDGKPYILTGTQGGEGQPQTQLSVLTGVLDYGLSIREAIELPRWVYGRTWGSEDDSLKVEPRFEAGVEERLSELGHKVERVREWDGIMGQSQGILIDETGTISGAADPRGDGSVIGW